MTAKKNHPWPYNSPGIDDGLFLRGDVPMTKAEVRAVTVSKLKLRQGMAFLDIGAGTGSVSIEAAVAGCDVTAVERHEAGVHLIQRNGEAFGVPLHILHGKAPEALPVGQVFDRVFIGGTGGAMTAIFGHLKDHLSPGGILVANTVTIENAGKFLKCMKQYGYEQIEATQVQVSRSKAVGALHMMMAENPITIISARKPLSNSAKPQC